MKSNSTNNQLNRRNFLRYSGAILSTETFLSVCGKKPVAPAPVPPVKEVPALTEPQVFTISCWGDSLTAGSGGKPYATMLKDALPDRTINYYAISGQLSNQIAARQGGKSIQITVEGNAFTGADAVKITNISTKFLSTGSNQNIYVSKGKVAGVVCEITRTVAITPESKTEVYTIKPLETTTVAIAEKSVFIPEESETTKSDTQILWMGRNDTPRFEQNRVLDSIESCINHLDKPARFAVIGVLNGANEPIGSANYNAIKAFNEILASKYPNNFIPSTPPTEDEIKALNYILTEEDKTDIANGAFPKGLRNDNIHLNNRGYQVIANRVEAFLEKNPTY